MIYAILNHRDGFLQVCNIELKEDESIEDYLEAYGADLDVIDVMPIRGIIMDVNLSDTVPFQVIRGGGGDDDKGRFA